MWHEPSTGCRLPLRLLLMTLWGARETNLIKNRAARAEKPPVMLYSCSTFFWAHNFCCLFLYFTGILLIFFWYFAVVVFMRFTFYYNSLLSCVALSCRLRTERCGSVCYLIYLLCMSCHTHRAPQLTHCNRAAPSSSSCPPLPVLCPFA